MAQRPQKLRGRDIKQLRQEKPQINQERLYRRAGISLQELISIERERTLPSPAVERRILDAIKDIRAEEAVDA
jgi:DNA-binding XRE family transcriptional regulator